MGMTMACCLEATLLALIFCGFMSRGLKADHTEACEDNKVKLEKCHKVNFTCFISPTHKLDCSWSFQSQEKEAQITTTIGVYDGDKTLQTLESKESVGSRNSQIGASASDVMLQFNISQHNKWELCTRKFDRESLDILPPPTNFQASRKGSNLTMSWDKPICHSPCELDCLEFEVQIRDQVKSQSCTVLAEKLFYILYNADPTQSYNVRVRTRILKYCTGLQRWSNWTHSIEIPATESLYQLNTTLIIVISLGVPMCLLAPLLLVCQRLSKYLLPPIPSPPKEYLHVLQNTDTFVSPDRMAYPDEEITLVFYAEDEKPYKI